MPRAANLGRGVFSYHLSPRPGHRSDRRYLGKKRGARRSTLSSTAAEDSACTTRSVAARRTSDGSKEARKAGGRRLDRRLGQRISGIQDAEAALIEVKLTLSQALRKKHKRGGISRWSSPAGFVQANPESPKWRPETVRFDRAIVRSLLALGATRRELASAIAPRKTASAPGLPKGRTAPKHPKPVEALKHKDKRVDIPTEELREFVAQKRKLRRRCSTPRSLPRPPTRLEGKGRAGPPRPCRPRRPDLHPGKGSSPGADRRPARTAKAGEAYQ